MEAASNRFIIFIHSPTLHAAFADRGAITPTFFPENVWYFLWLIAACLFRYLVGWIASLQPLSKFILHLDRLFPVLLCRWVCSNDHLSAAAAWVVLKETNSLAMQTLALYLHFSLFQRQIFRLAWPPTGPAEKGRAAPPLWCLSFRLDAE